MAPPQKMSILILTVVHWGLSHIVRMGRITKDTMLGVNPNLERMLQRVKTQKGALRAGIE